MQHCTVQYCRKWKLPVQQVPCPTTVPRPYVCFHAADDTIMVARVSRRNARRGLLLVSMSSVSALDDGTDVSITSGCGRVGRGRSAGAKACPHALTKYIESPVFTAVVQSFKDSSRQAQQLTHRLRMIPLPKEIIVNDETQGQLSSIWLKLLTRPSEFYISSPNLHETRAYNRLAQMARGELIMFVQGDNCLPASSMWMLDATRIFGVLPRLAMLSARAGFDEVLNWKMASQYRNLRTWGSAPYKPLDHILAAGTARPTSKSSSNSSLLPSTMMESTPFTFALGVDNGPLIYRRDALLSAGGFDESYSCAGHVAMHYDFEMSIRFWLLGWQVGVFYGGSTNGMGGRKSQRNNAMRTERHDNELANSARVEALIRLNQNNKSLQNRIARSTSEHLTVLPGSERESVRQFWETRIYKLSKDRCYEALASNRSSGRQMVRASNPMVMPGSSGKQRDTVSRIGRMGTRGAKQSGNGIAKLIRGGKFGRLSRYRRLETGCK